MLTPNAAVRPASRPAAYLLPAFLLLAVCCSLDCGQQVAYQYVQSPVNGNASILLNLWGTLGACGSNSSQHLLVQLPAAQ